MVLFDAWGDGGAEFVSENHPQVRMRIPVDFLWDPPLRHLLRWRACQRRAGDTCSNLDCLECREHHQRLLDERHWVYLLRARSARSASQCAEVPERDQCAVDWRSVAARCEGRRYGHAWFLMHTWIAGARLPLPTVAKILEFDGVCLDLGAAKQEDGRLRPRVSGEEQDDMLNDLVKRLALDVAQQIGPDVVGDAGGGSSPFPG